MLIKNIKKSYPKIYKILEYNQAFITECIPCIPHSLKNCQKCHPRNSNVITNPSSLIRSKTKITDYVLTNEFDLFCTFTFNPKKTNSLDIKEAKKKMSNWLNSQKKHSPNLRYLIVAEYHKSGRIHFHALFRDYNGVLTFSGLYKNQRQIQNIQNWRWGFSTAVIIPQEDIEKVGYYLQKYIKKDMIKISNKKRYWASRNLILPRTDYNVDVSYEVHNRPLFIIDTYTSEEFTIYKILN